MKLLPLAAFFALLCVQIESQGILGSLPNPFGFLNIAKKPCERDPIPLFKDAVNDFSIQITKRASFYSNGHFIISPYSIWLSLAALAEFADKSVQSEIFKELNLPEEKCIRDKFYNLALGLETPGPDVRFVRNRALALDERANINGDWIQFIQSSNILSYIQVPFVSETFQNVYQVMGVSSKLAMDGNSILLDRLDYDGLWTSAFTDGNIEQAPFYNDLGQEIAKVEYLRMKSRVRLAHIPIIDAKVLELPVGSDGKYTLLLTMGVKSNTIKRIMEMLMSSIIVDIMSALTLSLIPIDVAVPRFSMSTGLDVRPMLEDIDIARIFRDPAATSFISEPAAQPGAYLQRVSINVTSSSEGRRGREPDNFFSGFLHGASDVATGLASAVGRDFIANRPFFFTLVETKTRATVFTGVYSNPENLYRTNTYRN